jgi:6-phosphogluconolactonase
LRLIIEPDARAAARSAAAAIEAACADAIRARGVAVVAFSGGTTPWPMFEELCHARLPWRQVHVAQVDERVAPPDDARRNVKRLHEILVAQGPLPAQNLLPMPVCEPDLDAAAAQYQATLEALCGAPMRLDIMQLGLGSDGHTASLVPGDQVLEVHDRDVAMSGVYQGTRRMTLTYPALNRARARLWLVTGADKRDALQELLSGSGNSPAVKVATGSTAVFTDLEMNPAG